MATLTIDLSDDCAIERGIAILQRLAPTVDELFPKGGAKSADKPKAAEKPAPAATPQAPAPTPGPAAPSPSAPAAATLDYKKDLYEPFLKFVSVKGRDAAAEMLKGFGIAKLPEAKAEQYPAIAEAIKKALA